MTPAKPKRQKSSNERRGETRRTIDKVDFIGYRAVLTLGYVFLLFWSFFLR
jgi:hypothetical protein